MSDDRHDLHDLHELFRGDLERIELPPSASWIPAANRRALSPWGSLVAIPAAAAVIALALVLAFALQLARGELGQVAKSPTPAPSVGVASPSALPPNASPMGPSPLASPTAAPLPPSTAVKMDKTLPASGQWALVLRRSYNQTPTDPNQGSGPPRPPTTDTISAVPLTARATTQRDTLELLSFTSQSAVGRLATDNLLREQFSPDGHRLVLSVTVGTGASARLGLVVVDLVSGTVGALTTDVAYHDDSPAWNPTGEEIAFSRTSVGGAAYRDAGVWVIRVDGSGLRRVLGGADAPPGTGVYSWNGDGTGIAYGPGFGAGGYNVLDLASGQHARVGSFYDQTGRGMADWRTASLAFVGAFAESLNGGHRFLVTADDQRGGGARTIVSGSELNTYFVAPRWRPRSNDILYIELFQDPDVQRAPDGSIPPPKNTRTVYVTDATGRAPKAVVTKVYGNVVAAWSPDGRDIVYVFGQGAAGALVLIAPDGTNERVVQTWGGIPETVQDWLDLTVLSL